MFFNTFLWWCLSSYYVLLNGYSQKASFVDGIGTRDRQESDGFQVVYQWNYLNYTWESTKQYGRAVETGRYIPANNAPTGMKFYRDWMFLTVPRFRPGIPATLVVLNTNDESNFHNPLLTPYPSWRFNHDASSCSHLQSVQSMEIDTTGLMWVIDGVRTNNFTRCPSKLVFLDLNNGGNVEHIYVFPEAVASQRGGFLNDIVIDEAPDHGDVFAYITDNSPTEPGIVVYSRKRDRSWKLRHRSMHPEPHAIKFPIEDYIFEAPVPVDGIALSPRSMSGPDRKLYYCAISSFSLYSIPTSALRTGRAEAIELVGQKVAQSDGIVIDERGTMYLTMLPLYGVAAWRTVTEELSSMTIVHRNKETTVWPDGFAFDQRGHLYLIANKVYNYIDLKRTPIVSADTPFRVLRTFTGTRSYLYG